MTNIVLRLRTVVLTAVVLALLLALPAWPRAGAVVQAQQSCEPFILNGAQDNTDSTGIGLATVTYDTDTNELTWTVTFTGLTTPVVAAHFHGPAGTGENAPPVVPVDHTTNPITGSETLTDEQEFELIAGLWYFNIHTEMFPAGEIRGQVVACLEGELPETMNFAYLPLANQ